MSGADSKVTNRKGPHPWECLIHAWSALDRARLNRRIFYEHAYIAWNERMTDGSVFVFAHKKEHSSPDLISKEAKVDGLEIEFLLGDDVAVDLCVATSLDLSPQFPRVDDLTVSRIQQLAARATKMDKQQSIILPGCWAMFDPHLNSDGKNHSVYVGVTKEISPNHQIDWVCALAQALNMAIELQPHPGYPTLGCVQISQDGKASQTVRNPLLKPRLPELLDVMSLQCHGVIDTMARLSNGAPFLPGEIWLGNDKLVYRLPEQRFRVTIEFDV